MTISAFQIQQSNMNPVSYEPINLDIGLTQDLQQNVEFAQSFGVPTKIIEVDDYSIQHSVISPHEEYSKYRYI